MQIVSFGVDQYALRYERSGRWELLENTDGKTFTEVLPSLNLVFGLADQQTIRVAIAKQAHQVTLSTGGRAGRCPGRRSAGFLQRRLWRGVEG